jgi:hypothetical protein
MNSQESSEKSGDFRRFDDLVRSERFFTATLLPAVLFHKDLQGVQRFLELIDQKATTECDRSGTRGSKGATKYGDLKDVEIITEFHIARDLNFAGLPLAANVAWTAEPAEPDEEGEPEQLAAPDVVIMAGEELVVCEGKFFSTFNAQVLNDQLRSQRSQVRHLSSIGRRYVLTATSPSCRSGSILMRQMLYSPGRTSGSWLRNSWVPTTM